MTHTTTRPAALRPAVTTLSRHNTDPLRALALTVEEIAPGAFRWRILERKPACTAYESLCFADANFSAYDEALATGYGELQRLIGPDMQFGPRAEPGRMVIA